jgi:RNA polymerase sigma-70 factor (ECF subfamily)
MKQKTTLPDLEKCDDENLVRLVLDGVAAAFGVVITRYNQRLYRAARAILRDDDEAEDAVQEAYLRAYANLATYRGEAALGTWLTKIVVNESLGRLRRKRPHEDFDALDRSEKLPSDVIPFPGAGMSMNPEQNAALGEIRRLVERAIDALPEPFRIIFVLRDVEGLSLEETSEQAGISEATVKTRLHRARKMLRKELDGTLSLALKDAFPFGGLRCARMRENVLRIIEQRPML